MNTLLREEPSPAALAAPLPRETRRDAVWLKEVLDEAVPDLLLSYQRAGGLNNRDAHNMPSKRAVGQICEGLLQILFPGFHDDDAIQHGSLEELTTGRMARVIRSLIDQVRKSVRIGDPHKPTGRTPPIIRKFCQALPEVRDLLRLDIEAAFDGDPATLLREEIILSYPCIEAIAIQRLAHRLHELGAPVLPRMMTEWAHSRTGIDIHPGAGIGTHFFIDHGTGVVIGETCRIGNHVKIYHGVTLGARSFVKDEEGHIIKEENAIPMWATTLRSIQTRPSSAAKPSSVRIPPSAPTCFSCTASPRIRS